MVIRSKETLFGHLIHYHHGSSAFVSKVTSFLTLPRRFGSASFENVVPVHIALEEKHHSKHADTMDIELVDLNPVTAGADVLEYALTYSVTYRGLKVGYFETEAMAINQGKTFALGDTENLLRTSPGLFDDMVQVICSQAHFSMLTGKFEISDEVKAFDEGLYRHKLFRTAEFLYAGNGKAPAREKYLLVAGEDSSEAFSTNFGPEIRMRSLRLNYTSRSDTPATPMMEVIWSAPSSLPHAENGPYAGTSYSIPGRHTYRQHLESFLTLYPLPAHHKPNFDQTVQNNEIFPHIRMICAYGEKYAYENGRNSKGMP